MKEDQEADWGPIIFWVGLSLWVAYAAVSYRILFYASDVWKMYLEQIAREEKLILFYQGWLEIIFVLNGIFFTFFFSWFRHIKKTLKSGNENWFLLKDVNFTDKKSLEIVFKWSAVFFFGLALIGFIGRILFAFMFF